jgi:DNA-binding MarR family transcriptional regulator
MRATATGKDAELRELLALEQIERNPAISQRQLARELGVALGVANACVRTLARKGLVKIRGESNRSITYHLTKEGLLRKAALALEWTNNTINDYVAARTRLRAQMEALAGHGFTRIAVLGADEAAELVALVAPECGMSVVAAIDAGGRRIGDALAGVPVVRPDELDAEAIDAIVSPAGTAGPSDLHSKALVIDLNGRPVQRTGS